MNKVASVTNFLLKYNVDIEKKVYSKLIDLFLNNSLIDVLPVFDMNVENIEKVWLYLKEKDFVPSNIFK